MYHQCNSFHSYSSKSQQQPEVNAGLLRENIKWRFGLELAVK